MTGPMVASAGSAVSTAGAQRTAAVSAETAPGEMPGRVKTIVPSAVAPTRRSRTMAAR